MDVEEALKTFEPLLDIKGLFYMLLLSPSASLYTQDEISTLMALMEDFHDLTEKAGQQLSKTALNSSIKYHFKLKMFKFFLEDHWKDRKIRDQNALLAFQVFCEAAKALIITVTKFIQSHFV